MNLKNKHKAVLRSCKEYTAIDAGTRWTLGADTGYVLMNELWSFTKAYGQNYYRDIIIG